MFAGSSAIDIAWGGGIRPEPMLSVSEWAEEHRVLSSRGSAEPGRWRNPRTPFLVEVMDCLSPSHRAQRIVLMKGAQVGGTECGNNWIGYVVHHAPGPMLAVQPTVELGKRFSRQRIEPLFEETPVLRGLVAAARERDSGNTMLSKEFAGGQLVITGANSAVGLRSMSARYLFMDEIDAYPGDVDGEGDPIALAGARSRTFGARKKAFLVSTPTIAGQSRIEREYLASDQRRYFVPCVHCRAMQWLVFSNLRWDKGLPDTVAYHCAECGAAMQERHKTAMLAGGEWRATSEANVATTVGFHLSALYSPVGMLSWAEIARDWEAAQGDDRAIKTFRNTVLGETWHEGGDAPDHVTLHATRDRDRALRFLPPGTLCITAAADVQSDRIEWDVYAWGAGLTAWLVDTGIIVGRPEDDATWRELTAISDRRYEDRLARSWPIDAFGCDSGYMSQAVYRWVAGSARRDSVFALDGRGGLTLGALNTPRKMDVSFDGRKIGAVQLWPVGTYSLKLEHYAAIRRTLAGLAEDAPTPRGLLHLPGAVDIEYCRQLTSEYLFRPARGRQEWRVMSGVRNERLDTAVYARALAHHLTDSLSQGDWQALAASRATTSKADMAQYWAEMSGTIATPPAMPQATVVAPPPPRIVLQPRPFR